MELLHSHVVQEKIKRHVIKTCSMILPLTVEVLRALVHVGR